MPDIVRKITGDALRRRRLTGLVHAPETDLLLRDEVLPAGAHIDIPTGRIDLRHDTLLVFADDLPGANWAHPCRYLLYQAGTGDLYEEVPAQFPPYLRAPVSKLRRVSEPWRWPRSPIRLPQIVTPELHLRRAERYAVLFSGASNGRHVNDLEFLYRTLRDVYGYKAGNIYVLNRDGQLDWVPDPQTGEPSPGGNWPGDDTPYRMAVTGKGTRADLDAVLDELAGRMGADDSLLLHTNNHGYQAGGVSQLCTYAGGDYGAADLAAKLGSLPRFGCLTLMMEQCNSGGFLAPIVEASTASRTSVASAVPASKSSWGWTDFNPFACDWISAMARAGFYGGLLASSPDSNQDGRVQPREAFAFADARASSTGDDPQYAESSTALGGCTLSQVPAKWPPWLDKVLREKLRRYRRVGPMPPGPDPWAALHERVRVELLPRLEALVTSAGAVPGTAPERLAMRAGEIVENVLRR